ncbi:MAG TPA: hypothetical protein VKC33_06210 [Burkholderiales bacterium]|nr:hypothetical protein [Burkholderiales bacterium]
MSVQRGFALIALLALAALISAFLIASALNLTSAGNSKEREDRSMSALRQAKAALITYAASEQWQLYKGQVTDQPGALPCPDINHDGTESDEGNSDCVGLGISSTTNLIGRIPWKTLGVDDLRDASGERIWYALSFNFRKLSGTTVINSDTQPCDTPACNAGEIQLTVTGTAPASNVVAIVFAPGPALDLRQTGGPLQNRPADHTDPAYKDPINYLENFSLGDVTGRHYSFTTNAIPVDTFNDRLLVITQADLMAAVEPVVAARIERDVKPLLTDYFNKWGAYPFAVPFASPPVAQGAYLGTSSPAPGTSMGLLPVTNTASFTWQNASVTQIIPGGTGTSTVTSSSCSISSLTVTCTVNYNGTNNNDRPDIRLEVFLANASMAFADTPSSPTAPADFAMLDGNGNVPDTHNSDPYGYWSNIGSFEPQMSFVAQLGGGALTYTGRLQNFVDMHGQATITFSLPAPPGYLPRLTNPSTTNPNIAWFISNQWYRQTYYAVSPGFAPGGVPPGNPPACNPPPSCLTVNNLPAPTNNKQAILVFAGRALNGSIRPSANLADYLEGQNSTPADFIYEHRAGTATAINDRVVVVSP